MNIFNSLGSNYNFSFVLKSLFANNKESHKEKLIKFLEKKYGGRAILVYKGREAIILALEILKLPKGSFVAINGFTCFAVYKAIETAGYEPVCLDLENESLTDRHSGKRRDAPYGASRSAPRISPNDGDSGVLWTNKSPQNDRLGLNFSPQSLLKAIEQNPKIKVVIIQNTLGYPCDIEGIAKICRENSLVLIEDLAHCVGTRYSNSKEAGTVEDFVVLSFSQDKIIDAVSGGALIIRNKKYINRHSGESRLVGTTPESLRNLHDRGDSGKIGMTRVNTYQQLLDRFYPLLTFIIRKTYPLVGIGKIIHFILKSLNLLSKPMNEAFYTKYDLPNWYCSLILDAFDNLEKNLEHRKRIAAIYIYNSMLYANSTSQVGRTGHTRSEINLSTNLRYSIFVENRGALINYLKKRGVYVSDIWYDSVDDSLTNAKKISEIILNLPTHINITKEHARNVCKLINEWAITHV